MNTWTVIIAISGVIGLPFWACMVSIVSAYGWKIGAISITGTRNQREVPPARSSPCNG